MRSCQISCLFTKFGTLPVLSLFVRNISSVSNPKGRFSKTQFPAWADKGEPLPEKMRGGASPCGAGFAVSDVVRYNP